MAKISEVRKLSYTCGTNMTINVMHNMKFPYVFTIMVIARCMSNLWNLDPGLLQN